MNTQRKIAPQDYAPNEKPMVMKMMEREKVKDNFNTVVSFDGIKKIIDGVPEAPFPVVNGDENCPFSSCFTSIYMYLENFTGSEPVPCFWNRYADECPMVYCNRCGECGKSPDADLTQGTHNLIHWFFMLIMGGRINKINPNALFDYVGYRYDVLTNDDGFEQVKSAVVKSISNNVPLLVTFKSNANLCNLITGYDNKGDTIIGYDGNFTYWKVYVNDNLVQKDGYLDNHMFYFSNWFNEVDKVYIITGKDNPKINLKDALHQLADNINEDNKIFMTAAHNLLINNTDGMNEDEIRELFETGATLFREQMDTRHKLTLSIQSVVFPMVPEKYYSDVVFLYQSLAAAGSPGYEYLDQFEVNMWDVFGGKFKDYLHFMENPIIRINLAELMLKAYRDNRNAANTIDNLLLKWQRDDDIANGKTGLEPLKLKDINVNSNNREISIDELNSKIKVINTNVINFNEGLEVWGNLTHSIQNEQVTVTMDNDRSMLTTKNKYSIPVKIDMRVKTENKDICLYFEKGKLILNWSDNESELRINDIATGKGFNFAGKGSVPKNEFINISWIIHNNFMAVVVNDEVRHYGTWCYPYMYRYLDKISFRFGTNRNNTITVESLIISELE